jgi:phenylalanyl-tRNA synthetase beta chain
MRISWNWLRTLIDTDLDPHAAAAILTSTGLEVESVTPVEPVAGMLEGVVVGAVLERAKHPDADRLSVCQVDLGTGTPATIVCGAPNVAAGQKVLVATVGSTLHPVSGEPLTIKRSKIRGVESQGMICAEDELGLGTSHDGIMVLPADAVVGTTAAEHLGLVSDFALEIGLTPNRADAMGHAGVARDLAAALNARSGKQLQVRWPDVSAFVQDVQGDAVQVEVRSPEGAPRYAGLTLTHVAVAPSPAWLQDRLKSIGLKPINNVVDVTNFVQHELGQPLHAFDADKLAGRRIVVRDASAGEPFVTLDGIERKLDTADLVIADGEVSACIAGVFGGLHSGVTEATTTVFLESACFNPARIRRTARRHGLQTDASFRFERGVDPEITVYALKRAALLLREVAGARIASAITDVQHAQVEWRQVGLSLARTCTLIGAELSGAEVERALVEIGCRIVDRSGDGFVVAVPPYRVDVLREADLIEEVLRIVGFDRVPVPEVLRVPSAPRAEEPLETLHRRIAAHLAARGFKEVMTPSLVSAARMVEVQAAVTGQLVHVRNPLSAELDVLRPSMMFGLLQSAAHNIARQQPDLRLFERGRVYAVHAGAAVEEERIAFLITGAASRERWRKAQVPATVEDAKAEVELLLERLGVPADLEVSDDPLLNGCVRFSIKEGVVARVGLVAPAIARAMDVRQSACFAELMVERLATAVGRARITHREVPRFPSVRRDLSLLLDAHVTYAGIERAARGAERKLLRQVDLFDVYEGDKLPPGKKSYALSFVLQDSEKTLTDEQVDKAMGRIRTAIEQATGAVLRG